jgi:hypothetical protein
MFSRRGLFGLLSGATTAFAAPVVLMGASKDSIMTSSLARRKFSAVISFNDCPWAYIAPVSIIPSCGRPAPIFRIHASVPCGAKATVIIIGYGADPLVFERCEKNGPTNCVEWQDRV